MEDKNFKHYDYNCDLAQTFDGYDIDKETSIIDYMSSVNVSCAFHSGDPLTISKVVDFCKNKSKVLGAHIGFPSCGHNIYDVDSLSSDEIESIVLYQLGALTAFAKSKSLSIEYVRPHGLMYQKAAVDYEFSLTLAKSIKKFGKWLLYYGAAGELLEKVEAESNLICVHEVSIDRPYKENLLPDFESTKRLSKEDSLKRLKSLIKYSEIYTDNGEKNKIKFDTIHFNTLSNEVMDLVKECNDFSIPYPANYNKADKSGWV